MWDDDDDMDDQYDPEEDRRKLEALPIYQKAIEILELTKTIVDAFDKSKEAEIHSRLMMEDAYILPAKIAGAEAMDDFVLRMENATIIKIHARSLLAQTSSAKFLELINEEYLQLLRNEIEAFRVLFKAWVKTFHKFTKEGDGWGLFVDDED